MLSLMLKITASKPFEMLLSKTCIVASHPKLSDKCLKVV